MPCYDLLIQYERAETNLRKAEDAKDIDSFNFWYCELMRICDIMQSYPLG